MKSHPVATFSWEGWLRYVIPFFLHTCTYKNHHSSPAVAIERYHLCVWPSSSSQDHSDLMVHPSYLHFSGSHGEFHVRRQHFDLQSVWQLCTTQGWKETTTGSYWNYRCTTHNTPSRAQIEPGIEPIHTLLLRAARDQHLPLALSAWRLHLSPCPPNML